MRKYQLREFEEIVLLIIVVLQKNAYCVSIKVEIESRLNRNVSMGALHTGLLRLEGKGYIISFSGDKSEERAGRPRRYFQITTLGQKAIEYTRSTRDALWKAIPKLSVDVKMAEK